MGNFGDQLLYALSTRSTLSWQAFKKHFSQLLETVPLSDILNDVQLRRHITRVWDAMGLCDFVFGETRNFVSVGQRRLVLIPQFGLPECFVTGSQTPDLIDRVVRVGSRDLEVKIADMNDAKCDRFIPHQIRVKAASLADLENLAKQFQMAFSTMPFSWQIAQNAGSIEEYQSKLNMESVFGLNWRQQTFDSERCVFNNNSQGESTLYRFQNPNTGLWKHYFRVHGQCALVDLDWGRFLALKEAKRHIFGYDSSRACFISPTYLPLPKFFARSLVFCSGKPPDNVQLKQSGCLPSDLTYIGYHNVHEVIARTISSKLDQSLISVQIA